MSVPVIPAPPPSRPRGEMYANPNDPADNRFQVAWDSTSLGLLKECPRKYQLTILHGWRPRWESVHLTFGLLYHSGLEGYDHFAASIGKLEGNLTDDEHDEGTLRAVRRAVQQSGKYTTPPCPACDGQGFILPQSSDPADLLAAPPRCELCHGERRDPNAPVEWQPWKITDPNKNIVTLTRSLVWYCDHFRTSPLHTVLLSNGKPAVELSFFFEAGVAAGHTYGFSGHIDRMAIDVTRPSAKPGPHDRKTTKGAINNQYWKQYNPHNQFSLYNAACALHYSQPTWGLTVDAAQVLVNSTNFDRRFIAFPPQLTDEWLREADSYINLAAMYASMGFWPRNDKSCSNYGGCPFIPVCSKSAEYRQGWLTADFVYHPWNPMETRGDI